MDGPVGISNSPPKHVDNKSYIIYELSTLPHMSAGVSPPSSHSQSFPTPLPLPITKNTRKEKRTKVEEVLQPPFIPQDLPPIARVDLRKLPTSSMVGRRGKGEQEEKGQSSNLLHQPRVPSLNLRCEG